jgi:hypothetical protein
MGWYTDAYHSVTLFALEILADKLHSLLLPAGVQSSVRQPCTLYGRARSAILAGALCDVARGGVTQCTCYNTVAHPGIYVVNPTLSPYPFSPT